MFALLLNIILVIFICDFSFVILHRGSISFYEYVTTWFIVHGNLNLFQGKAMTKLPKLFFHMCCVALVVHLWHKHIWQWNTLVIRHIYIFHFIRQWQFSKEIEWLYIITTWQNFHQSVVSLLGYEISHCITFLPI